MSWTWAVFMALVGSILGSAALSTIISSWQASRLRKQEIFAKAYQIALRRVEMLYRILRRTGESDEDAKLRDAMHEVQEDTSYYSGLLTIESAKLGLACTDLIEKIKAETADSFRIAWKSAPGKPSAELKNFNHPKFAKEETAFLVAAREHFRPFNVIRLKILTSSYKDGVAS